MRTWVGSHGGSRALRVRAVPLVAALALAGCGGASQAPLPPATDAGSPTEPVVTQAVAGTPASVQVGASFWFAGFKVDLGSATFDPAGELGPTVTVEAMFENLGSAPTIFDGTASLASGGVFYEPSLAQELPTVPGRATGAGAFIFEVEESFTFDDATLTIGLADLNQAVIPLGATGEAITLEPSTLQVRGKARAGAIAIKLTGGELRADVPERHEQIDRGHLALTLDFDVSNHGSYEGGFAFSFALNLALELPDGTTIAADDGPIELLFLGTTLPDQQVRFTVPDPPGGRYGLVLIDDTVDRRGTVPFEIA